MEAGIVKPNLTQFFQFLFSSAGKSSLQIFHSNNQTPKQKKKKWIVDFKTTFLIVASNNVYYQSNSNRNY